MTGMVDLRAGYGSREFGKTELGLVDKADARKRRSDGGTAVGVGTTVSGLGLVGGGVPGARPDSGRLAHRTRGTKIERTAHLVSATRGGVFGYREDAHRSFLNRQNSDLRGWRPTNRGNHYERGTVQGKAQAEKQIIRHLRVGRNASNAVLAGGGALVATGLVQRRRQRRSVAKRDDYKSNAVIAGGGALAVAGAGGSRALDAQGRKWAKRSAASLDASNKINPHLGGYDIKQPAKKTKRSMLRTSSRVPDVVPHRNFADLNYNNRGVWHRRSNKDTIAAGKLRGQASQQRYFARVYGKIGQAARKTAVGGVAVGAAGLGSKYLEVKVRPREVRKVEKSYVPGKGYIRATEAGAEALRAAAAPKSGGPGVTLTARQSYLRGRKANRKSMIEVSANQKQKRQQRRIDQGKPVSPLNRWASDLERRTKPEHFPGHGWRSPVTHEGLSDTRARQIQSWRVQKVETTMSDAEAKRTAARYDTRGPLPKGLTREQKMKAYEGRYIASGGRKAEKWKRRANAAEVGRNIGLAGATAGAAVTLAARGRRLGPTLRKVKVTPHRADNATIGSAAFGGASELYGEHARSRRASYQNSPGGVAGSALSRMQAYTPEKRKP
jgi:hypothetical protein